MRLLQSGLRHRLINNPEGTEKLLLFGAVAVDISSVRNEHTSGAEPRLGGIRRPAPAPGIGEIIGSPQPAGALFSFRNLPTRER
jgi:hypothetical protein